MENLAMLAIIHSRRRNGRGGAEVERSPEPLLKNASEITAAFIYTKRAVLPKLLPAACIHRESWAEPNMSGVEKIRQLKDK